MTQKKPSRWVVAPQTFDWVHNAVSLTALQKGAFAVNDDYAAVCLVDGAAKLLARFEPAAFFGELQFLEKHSMLAVIGSKHLELLDVSNLRRPVVQRRFTYDVGHRRALCFMGSELYVTHKNGVARLDLKTGKPRHLFNVPKDPNFESYPTALESRGEFLYVTGRHAGLHVYRRGGPDVFERVCSVKRGFTPTQLQWWRDDVLLLVGNEDLIAVDTSTPRDARLMKSCKVKGVELLSPLLKLSAKTGFVAGANASGKLVLATVDLLEPLAPRISESELVADRDLDFTSASVVRVGKKLFVCGRQTSLRVLQQQTS